MQTSTTANLIDPLAPPAKAIWEDPALTLERDLQVRAQEGPPAGGPPQIGPNRGFIGPLSGSPPNFNCQ